MRLITVILALAFVAPVFADNAKNLSYWKSATIEQINAANQKIAYNVNAATDLINKDAPDYSKAESHLNVAMNLCNAMHCKSSKGICLEAFKVSGMVGYLKNSWVPTLAEINKPTIKNNEDRVSLVVGK
jgi:hypothetical protein